MEAWVDKSELVNDSSLIAEEAIEMATAIIFKLTGSQYTGIYEAEECFSRCVSESVVHRPKLIDGKMYNLPLSSKCIDNRLYVRGTPVYSIKSVSINGKPVDKELYGILDNIAIVRKDGQQILSSTDKVCITYTTGRRIPKPLKRAVRRLADELILWDLDDDSCAIPTNAMSISRQGESFTLMSPEDFISEGKTGIYDVDQLIKAYSKQKTARFLPTNRLLGESVR